MLFRSTVRYCSSAKAAHAVIAISNHAKESLVARYEIHPRKISVIYHGVNNGYRPIDDSETLNSARSRLGLTRPFIYYPAATWPHKNHGALLEALQILIERYGFDGQLVLTGVEKSAHEKLQQDIACRGVDNVVLVLGYLPYPDLPILFNLAKLMVFPSLFEGFGLPVLEAMACGCPVVCSGTTSLPEVADDAAMYFDPKRPEDIAEKIWDVWNNIETQTRLRSAGIARAARFDWQETARHTSIVYHNVITSTAGRCRC